MSTSTPRVRRALASGIAAATLLSGAAITSFTPAVANPGDGGPGGANGAGDVWITSSTTVAKGEKLSFAGRGFAKGGNAAEPAMQKVNVKLDAFSSERSYTGTANDAKGTVGAFQVQADGTVSGSIVVPNDIDDPEVNGTAAGPHFLRFLGGNPALSRWSDDFTVSAAAPAAPSVTATATTASRRGSVTVSVAVKGTGFGAGETVTVTRALNDTPLGTVTTDGAGAIDGTFSVAAGVLPAGEHQLLLTSPSTGDNPGVAQVVTQASFGFAGLAVASTGTVTVTNAAPGATYTSVKLDPTPAAGDEVEVLDAPFTADASGVGSGEVTIADSPALLGTKDFDVTQSFPYPVTTELTAKVSPSTATFGEEKFDITSTPDGAVEQGLYQSAYSAKNDKLFVAAANVLATSGIYKLDPTTLKVEAKVQPATQSDDATKLWAAYGIGVDDTNNTVWVTNTRQDTVAVYSQTDLKLLKQFPAGTLIHTRDVIHDPKTDRIFVSSASERTTGNGAIGVFEANDEDGDGVKYEHIKDVGVRPRTVFSPMSLELDVESGKLFSVSLTTQAAIVIDTTTLAETVIELPDLMTGGRGASGVAFDPVTKRLFVASQNSDEVLIAQLNDSLTAGTTVKEVATGAGALNVAFDPVNRWAYVSNFGGTTVTVLDVDGNKVANLPVPRANHVHEDGKGNVFVVNKDTGNRVFKISPRKETPSLPAGTVKVSGKAKVGTKLTASPTGWPAGTSVKYSWKRGTTVVATSATYTPKAADQGKKLTVTAVGTLAGHTDATASATTATVAKGTLKTGKVKVKGKAKVGKTLTAAPGSWTKRTKLTYTWLANGKAIKGAKAKKLKLTKKLKGKKISVKVTGKLAGYAKASKTSAKTAKVKK